MDFQIRVHYVQVHRWVLWWFWLGVILGAIALANILLRDLPRTQEQILLGVGVIHWLLGGIVCYAVEGIRFEKPPVTPQPRCG